MLNSYIYKATAFFILMGLSNITTALELSDAEKIALNISPEIKQIEARRQTIIEESIAEGQLPDPILTAGLMNMPVDTFDFDQEPMTQIQLGLQQNFPKGRSLKYAKQRKEHLSFVEIQNKESMKLEIIRAVRLSWLDLLYWIKVSEKTKEQKSIFTNLLDITESLLANNKAQQHDVIRAQLELTEIDNRLIEIEKEISLSKAQLARWIGREYENQLVLRNFPTLPEIRDLSVLRTALQTHPQLLADRSKIASLKSSIKWACEQYKPGITTGLAYGIRQGRNLEDSKRADFLTATIKMDLPIFRGNRQDRRVKASQNELISIQEKEIIDYKDLLQDLDEQYAIWQEYTKKVSLYTNKLVPQAIQYAEASLLAYKNGKTDFPTLARSYVRELDTRIDEIKASIEQRKAHVKLLYLKGNDNV